MRRIKIIAVLLAATLALCATGCGKNNDKTGPEYANSLTVSVEGGLVTGTESEDNEVAIYKGIPYAAPPVGDLRWKAPQPVVPWEDELDCTLWGANALQGDAGVFSYWTEEFVQDVDPAHYRDGIVYSEDCLTLNVWSSYGVTRNKPVLVFVHGGGYNSGGASCEVYDGETLARDGVVFVSIQYRVGALGYMATPALMEEGVGAGNYGLLDQIAALKWVKNNIAKFGGNPDNVTVFGQSAGAGSVNALICSPLAKGLFTKAVSASHNSINREDWQTIQARCSQLNLTYNGKRYADMTAEELRDIPVSELKGKTLATGGPCIDGLALVDTYNQTVIDGKANPVTLISGNVAEDNLITNASAYTDSGRGITVVDSMLALQSGLCSLRAEYTSEPTYIYMFGHNVPRSTSGTDNPFGAKHSYELAYFFGNFSTVSGRAWKEEDYALGESMRASLAAFCATGDPSVADVLQWDSNTGGYNFMRFSGGAEQTDMDDVKTAAVLDHYGLNFD